MFVKHGDDTKSFSIEKTGGSCEICNQQKININGKIECGCSENKIFEKSKKILTQDNLSANFQENKRVEDV